jgi:hypothetical protein
MIMIKIMIIKKFQFNRLRNRLDKYMSHLKKIQSQE